MLYAPVKYTKTGDEKHLLSLPLEHRQLLEDVLPAVAAGAARQTADGQDGARRYFIPR